MSRLLRHEPSLRVLCMSGYTRQAATEIAGLPAGLPFLQKPFTAVEFSHRVRAVLNI